MSGGLQLQQNQDIFSRLVKNGVSGRELALRGSGECSHTGPYAALPPSPRALATARYWFFNTLLGLRGHTPGHFTSRAGRSRKASGHDAVLRVLRMARNAAGAADTARPKSRNFSASPTPKSLSLTGANRTRRSQPHPGSRCLISLPISSMLKNFHEMFGPVFSLRDSRIENSIPGYFAENDWPLPE
jgi:hypothetical protein